MPLSYTTDPSNTDRSTRIYAKSHFQEDFPKFQFLGWEMLPVQSFLVQGEYFLKKFSVHHYMTDQPCYDGRIKGRPGF
jgi:hypothetical protein